MHESRYILINNKKLAMSAANDMCVSLGGELASIMNPEENKEIHEQITKDDGQVWLAGIKLKDQEWSWKSETNKWDKEVAKLMWQPTLDLTANKDCLGALLDPNVEGEKWGQAECTKELNFVCQFGEQVYKEKAAVEEVKLIKESEFKKSEEITESWRKSSMKEAGLEGTSCECP